MKKKIILNWQIACIDLSELPRREKVLYWIQKACLLSSKKKKIEVTVRIVEKREIKKLNYTYRGKNVPTNILSFPFENQFNLKLNFLGDLVICHELIKKEAEEQEISIEHRWARIITHGILHLLKFNHSNNKNRERMRSMEKKIMNSLNYHFDG